MSRPPDPGLGLSVGRKAEKDLFMIKNTVVAKNTKFDPHGFVEQVGPGQSAY